ncbi:MAG: cell division protein ZapA [Oscillospiraceae bacterium]|nr:cell division protein ZapA [Oscillospiraceae bacterium]
MNSINSVRVSIAGRDYNLRTDDAPEYLMETALRLDTEIKSLLRDKPSFGIQNAAVIAGLMAFDESRKANDAIDNIRGQIKTYVADAAKARAAKDKLQDRIKALEATVDILEKAVRKLEKENAELKKNQSPFAGEQLVLDNTISGDKKEEPSEKAAEKADSKDTDASSDDAKADDDDSGDDTVISIDDEIAEYLGEGQPRRKGKRKRR